MDTEEVAADIATDVGRPLLPKMTERVFVQIVTFNPVPWDTERLKSLIITRVIDNIVPMGFVYIPPGFSKLTHRLVGYWIVVRKDNDIFKIKIGTNEEEFRTFLYDLRWENVEQIYL
jgi:hypothetical protein